MLTGRIAVVTGAGRGLGRHIAVGLAAEGARVVLTARSQPQLEETAGLIWKASGEPLTHVADIGDPDGVARMRDRVLAELGPPGILVNAAGIFGPIQPIGSSDPHRWIETITTNTIGPYLTCRAFVGDMVDRGWGRIVTISSAATLHPPGPLNSGYGTSKVAVNQLTRHLAAELAGSGVTANVIHPGEVKTAMWAAVQAEAADTGREGAGLRDWAAAVGSSGGDDPQRAVELILSLVSGPLQATSGRFLWISGGHQAPIPSW